MADNEVGGCIGVLVGRSCLVSNLVYANDIAIFVPVYEAKNRHEYASASTPMHIA